LVDLAQLLHFAEARRFSFDRFYAHFHLHTA